MAFDDYTLLYAALFIGVLLLFEGVYQLTADVRTGPRAQVNRRMQMLADGSNPKEVLASLRRERRAEGLFVPSIACWSSRACRRRRVGRRCTWAC
jgi:hypothetical protein